MLRTRSLVCVTLTLICTICASAQPSAPDGQSQEQLSALIKEVRAQQTELAANQAKIDEKLASLAEAIRQARIYASRGGR